MASVEREAAELSQRLERINNLTEQLLDLQGHSDQALRLADKIHAEIAAARKHIAIQSFPAPHTR